MLPTIPISKQCRLDILLKLSHHDYQRVNCLFQRAIQDFPELILLGLAQTNPNISGLRADLMYTLVPQFLLSDNVKQTERVLQKLWALNHHDLVISALGAIYEGEQQKVSARHAKILCQLDGALDKCLQEYPIKFQVEILVAVSKIQSELQATTSLRNSQVESSLRSSETSSASLLETWLTQCLVPDSPCKNAVFTTSLNWLESNATADTADPATLAIFFKAINASKVCSGTQAESRYNRIYDEACKKFTSLSAIKENDIVEQANAYFQRIYTSEQSIEDAVKMLKTFKNSSDPREADVFACMIHNLFDEYRFFFISTRTRSCESPACSSVR